MIRRVPILILLAFFVAPFFFLNPIFIFIARNIIQQKMPGSKFTVEKCELGLNHLKILNAHLSKPNDFDLTVRRLHAYYDFGSLWQHNVPLINIRDAVFTYKKLKIVDIQGQGHIINGQYFANVRFTKVYLGDVMSSFKLNEKLSWEGHVYGEFIISGDVNKLKTFKGTFLSEPQGGTIMIKDSQFLVDMARNSKLPPNLVVDSFKNYHYNYGIVHLSLEQADLILDLSLNGETGKRNLTINLHDAVK